MHPITYFFYSGEYLTSFPGAHSPGIITSLVYIWADNILGPDSNTY